MNSKQFQCSLCHKAYDVAPLLTQCCHSTGCISCLSGHGSSSSGRLSLVGMKETSTEDSVQQFNPLDENLKISEKECPFCSQKNFQTVENKIIKRLMEGKPSLGTQEDKEMLPALLMCERCGECESEWKCRDCGNIQLCGVCSKLLHSLGVYAKHKLQELKDTGTTVNLMNSVFYGDKASPSKRLQAASSIYCKVHPRMVCSHFDMDSWKPVCLECVRLHRYQMNEDSSGLRSPPHQERNLLNIEVALCKTLHDIRQKQKLIANKLIQQTQFQKNVSAMLEDNELKFEEMQRKIKKGFEDLRLEISLKQNEMLQDLMDLKIYNKGTIKDSQNSGTKLQDKLSWLNQLVLAALDQPQFLFLEGFQFLQTQVESFMEQQKLNLGSKAHQLNYLLRDDRNDDSNVLFSEDEQTASSLPFPSVQYPVLPNFSRLKKIISALSLESPSTQPIHQSSPHLRQKELFGVIGGTDISPAGTFLNGERLNSARASIFTDRASIASKQKDDRPLAQRISQKSKKHYLTATKIRRFTKSGSDGNLKGSTKDKENQQETIITAKPLQSHQVDKTLPSFRKKVNSIGFAHQTPKNRITPDIQRGLQPQASPYTNNSRTPKRNSLTKKSTSTQQLMRRADSDNHLNPTPQNNKSFYSIGSSSNKLRSNLRKQGYFNSDRKESPINGISAKLQPSFSPEGETFKKEKSRNQQFQSQSSYNSEQNPQQLETSYSSLLTTGDTRKKPLHKFRYTNPSSTNPSDSMMNSVIADPLAARQFILTATTSSSIQVGWTHIRSRQLPTNQQMIYLLEYELKSKLGQDFRKIYKGRAFKCIITDLIPNTQYRFRVAPILVKETGIEIQGDWNHSPVTITTNEPQKIDQLSLHSHAILLHKDGEQVVRFKKPGIVHALNYYTFGRQYWWVKITATAEELSAALVIGIVAKNDTATSKMIGTNYNFNLKKGHTQIVKVMLNAEASSLTVFAPNQEPDSFTNLPEGFHFYPAVFNKSSFTQSKPAHSTMDVIFLFDLTPDAFNV